jgi:hypothetical protein
MVFFIEITPDESSYPHFTLAPGKVNKESKKAPFPGKKPVPLDLYRIYGILLGLILIIR